MSLSASLANALTGLAASARAASVVSSNVSNALTEGYARRELNLSAQSLGGTGAGVRIDGVTRVVDRALLTDRRLADAEAGNARLQSGFLARIEALTGTPGEAGSLSDRIVQLESALIQASGRPDSQARLQAVTDAAKGLAGHLNALSDAVQQERMDADAGIAAQVRTLNESLVHIDRLNAEILSQTASGRDATALMDQRQILVDRVAEIVPVREVARDGQQISLYTTGGAILLEGNPATVGFTAAGMITPDMTLASGALSGFTVDGRAVSSGDDGALGGGTLGALVAIRDGLAPAAQAQLDAVARDLVERLASPAVDPTLAPGAAGLLTDGGSPFAAAAEEGLADRISLSALVDPAAGGQLWRLRDGLGAAAPGPVGDARLLDALGAALSAARPPASGSFIGAARSASGLAADLLSGFSGDRQRAEARESYATARQDALTEMQLAQGVDTDAEMQTLLLVEQAYAANARVLKTIDDLIQQLIGL